MARFHDLAKKFSAPDTNYVLPAKTKKEAVAWIVNLAIRRQRFFGQLCNHYFCWNVKLGVLDTSGHNETKDFKLDEKHDDLWKAWFDKHADTVIQAACEEAASQYREGEYTSYPGDDQGDWKFSQMGRSGGWMVLTHWRGHDMRTVGIGNLEDWLHSLDDDSLFKLLVGLTCLEVDLDPHRVKANVEYYIAEQRAEKEREWAEADKATAEKEALRGLQQAILKGLIFDMKAQDHQWSAEDVEAMNALFLEIGGKEEDLG